MKRWIAPVLAIVAALAITPVARAASSPDTFLLIAEEENIETAANGDYVAVTVDEGSWFDASPKSVTATGDFTHFAADGGVRGAGTWTATSLISFSFYGCRFIPAIDVDLGDDNLCGGAVKMAVVLDTPIGQFPGVLAVFCIVGPMAPASHNGSLAGKASRSPCRASSTSTTPAAGRTSTSASEGVSGGEPAPAVPPPSDPDEQAQELMGAVGRMISR